MKKQLFFLLLATGFITAALWVTACKKDNTNDESKVFLPTERPYDKSYSEWTALWLQEFMTFNCTDNPWLNQAKNKVFYESGPVYFMAGISEVGGTANVTVPQGKAILFPLVNFLNDYPCPDSSFQPGPNQTMAEFLTKGAVDLMALVSAQSVTVDGVAIANVPDYLFTTDLFYFTANAALTACFDPCITGTSQPGVGSGNYVMLKPLSKGTHTVHYHMEITAWSAVQDGTFNITVQ